MKTPLNPADLTDTEIEHGLRATRQLENAPEHVIQRAMAVWQPRRQHAPAPGLLQRLMAVISFDSGLASPLSFGARSAGGAVRQLLYTADGHDIDLRISRAGEVDAGPWLFSGQILGPQAHGAVELVGAEGQVLGAAALSELGEFRLPAVAAGRYTLCMRIGERVIELPALDVPQVM